MLARMDLLLEQGPMKNSTHPVALLILDGWGHSTAKHNPLKEVPTPNIDYLFKHCPHRLIEASGTAVGLPEGQIGNSEVGHLQLGAGRLIMQDLTRINDAIAKHLLDQNPVLQKARRNAKESNKAIHLIGLVSPGGVHSHEDHIAAVVRLCAAQGISQCYIHAFLDGRDVPPRSAEHSLTKLSQLAQELKTGRIASLIGRYYAMDRDQRWDRVAKAYELLVEAKAVYQASDALSALKEAYARGESDEFIKPTIIGEPVKIADGDTVIFMNFRADRARQLSHALTDVEFDSFKRNAVVKLGAFLTLTEYDETLDAEVIFPSTSTRNTLGEYVANLGLKQLRIAETEKYAHVTYFFNGGIETPFANEDRCLIPSPKVATYDLQPEMSAPALTEQLINAILSQEYAAIVCNYANFDMVGHTGIPEAALKTIATIDACLGQVLAAVAKTDIDVLLTADHGNIECIYDEDHQQAHTAHTTNLVPLVYVGKRAASFTNAPGSLSDVAPTLLHLMGLEQPSEMTGQNLIELN